MDTMNTKPMNVLVVIDVQNCFMFHSEGETGGGTSLNVSEESTSEDIVKELDSLVDDKTHVVFSRDFHPVNHISLEGYEGRKASIEKGIWPKHCRNKTLQCKSRASDTVSQSDQPVIPNKIVDTTTGQIVNGEQVDNTKYLEVVGTDLSYMFYRSDKFREPVKQLVLGNREGKNKIGLDDTTSELVGATIGTIDKSDEERKIIQGESLDYNRKKYISLTKGERCDKEAYSAFNYHIEYFPSENYDPENTRKEDNIPLTKENSTGLWEWILQNKPADTDKITITVCGLVGNVCVMHSLLQGIALWNNVYSVENPSVKVKFIYSLQGTRFAKDVPSGMPVKPESFDDPLVGWFNSPLNLPKELGPIRVENGDSGVRPSEKVTSFEVLDYDGNVIKIGTFAPAAAAVKSGRRRHRHRSVRRTRNKSRKTTKHYKGRRTYKHKRRNTKRRL